MRSVTAIVQARMGSSRLPGKSLMPLGSSTVLGQTLYRLSASKRVTKVVVATTAGSLDDRLAEHVTDLGFPVYRGSEHDVLRRYWEAAREFGGDVIVRITADCPLVDPDLVDEVITKLDETQVEYVSNIEPRTYPKGLDVEAFTRLELWRTNRDARKAYDLEHVTTYMRRVHEAHHTRASVMHNCGDESWRRWTVDYAEDLTVLRNVFDALAPHRLFPWTEVLKLSPALFEANAQCA
jgi:glutamate-1-semialdehyde 2,1-aminomutase